MPEALGNNGGSFLGLPSGTNWLDLAQTGFNSFLQFRNQQNTFDLQSKLIGSGQSGVLFGPNGQPVIQTGVSSLTSGALGSILPIVVILLIGAFLLMLARR